MSALPGPLSLNSARLWLALLVVVVVCLRALLPVWLTYLANNRLAQIGDYSGHIADIDLLLIKGEYHVKSLQVEKTTGEVPVPFVKVPVINIGVSWRDLLQQGKVAATIRLDSPELNFVDGDDAMQDQTGANVAWHEQLAAFSPIQIDEFHIDGGLARLRNFESEPKVDIKVTDIDLRVNGLTNRPNKAAREASYKLTATLAGQAEIESEGEFHPFHALENFRMRLGISRFELQTLNAAMRVYANLDVASGTGELIAELEARNGQLTGYVKPLLENVEMLSWQQDVEKHGDSPFALAWEALAGSVEDLFKNQNQNQLATRVEIRGSLDSADVSALQAILGILKNAFVDAYKPVFEGLPDRKAPSDWAD